MSLFYHDSKRQPFPEPVFSLPSVVETTCWETPTGGRELIHWRAPQCAPADRRRYLTFIEDSCMHREDIMARQRVKMNKEWVTR